MGSKLETLKFSVSDRLSLKNSGVLFFQPIILQKNNLRHLIRYEIVLLLGEVNFTIKSAPVRIG